MLHCYGLMMLIWPGAQDKPSLEHLLVTFSVGYALGFSGLGKGACFLECALHLNAGS